MDHRELRAFVHGMRQLLIDKHRCDYRVGGALAKIRAERLWETWPRDDRRAQGYESFAEYCDRECGYSLSQANMKAANYEKLCLIGLPEDSDTFSRCMRLGWSKLNVLLRVAVNEPGLVAWLNDIEGKNLTEMQLRARIEEARAAHRGEAGGDGEDDERSPRGRRDAPDDPPTRPTTRGYVGYEVRFESQAGIDAFTRTVDMIRRRYGDVGMGRAIEMMAVHYLATVPTTAQGGAVIEVENLIRTFESAYGIKLRVVAPEPAPGRRKKQSKSLRSMRNGDAR